MFTLTDEKPKKSVLDAKHTVMIGVSKLNLHSDKLVGILDKNGIPRFTVETNKKKYAEMVRELIDARKLSLTTAFGRPGIGIKDESEEALCLIEDMYRHHVFSHFEAGEPSDFIMRSDMENLYEIARAKNKDMNKLTAFKMLAQYEFPKFVYGIKEIVDANLIPVKTFAVIRGVKYKEGEKRLVQTTLDTKIEDDVDKVENGLIPEPEGIPASYVPHTDEEVPEEEEVPEPVKKDEVQLTLVVKPEEMSLIEEITLNEYGVASKTGVVDKDGIKTHVSFQELSPDNSWNFPLLPGMDVLVFIGLENNEVKKVWVFDVNHEKPDPRFKSLKLFSEKSVQGRWVMEQHIDKRQSDLSTFQKYFK